MPGPSADNAKAEAARQRGPSHLRIGRYRFPIPRSKLQRTSLGVGLIVLGLVPLIPPGSSGVALGVALLSIDHPKLRRPRRRMMVAGGRWLKSLKGQRS